MSSRLGEVSLGFGKRLLLRLVARRRLGAREARAGIDVVDRAVENVADLIRLDFDRPAAELLPAAFVSLSLHLRLLHRRTDQVSPLGPRPVVVLDVLEAEQVFQHEPRDARPFADAAVRDHGSVARHALSAVKRLQLVDALERAVLVAVLAPGNALRARNVSAALAGFRKPGRREDLAGELRGAADVHERGLL